jgi:hypothetical protein
MKEVMRARDRLLALMVVVSVATVAVGDGGVAAAGVGQRHHAGGVQKLIGGDVQFADGHAAVQLARGQAEDFNAQITGQIFLAALVQHGHADVGA